MMRRLQWFGLLALVASIAAGLLILAPPAGRDGGGSSALAQERPTPASRDVDLDFSPPARAENRKLQTPLARLSAVVRAYGQPGAQVIADSMNVPLQNGAVRVIAEARPGRTDDVSRRAASLAIPVEGTYQNLVQLLIPVTLLDTLAQDPAVAFVRLPLAKTAADLGQGVSLIRADDWHTAGLTGDGTKVAILDMGFQGYTDLLGTELPSSVVTHSCRSDEDITGDGEVHGTAVAEVVHEVAPDAQLYLVNFYTEVELGVCVAWLKGEGVDVINHSVGWFASGPGDGTGTINEIVDSATAQGILWVNAAGNQAQRHWMGPWYDPDADDTLNFAGGDESNDISASAGQLIAVILKWDDPFGQSCNDYNLYLLDSNFAEVYGSEDVQDFCDSAEAADPVEFAYYVAAENETFHVVVDRFDADGSATFHLYSLVHGCPALQYCVKSGSILEPGDNPDVLTAGAVPWDSPDAIESFSSQGPTDDERTKPDVVAPDGVKNATYGSFFGTSASAPHAAGAAALVKDWQPSWTRDEIRSFLLSRAVDLGDPGADNVYGEGRLDLGFAPGVGGIAEPPHVAGAPLEEPRSLGGNAGVLAGIAAAATAGAVALGGAAWYARRRRVR